MFYPKELPSYQTCCYLKFFMPTIFWKNGVRLDRIRIRSDVVELDLNWTPENLYFRFFKINS